MSRRLGVLCGVLVLSLGLRAWLSATPAVPLRTPLATFPAALGDWQMIREHTLEERMLAVLRADDYLLRTYRNSEGRIVDFYVGYYENQHTGETMHSPKNCLPGWGWQAVESSQIPLESAPGAAPVRINRYLVEKDGQRALVLYWYQAHGRIIASEYAGKIYLVWDSLWRQRRDGALIRVVVLGGDDLRQAETQAREFARLLLPQLPRFLPN